MPAYSSSGGYQYRPRRQRTRRYTSVNTQQGSARFGQRYRVQKAPGGSWHIYANGRRVFVRAGTPRQTQPLGQPAQTSLGRQYRPISEDPGYGRTHEPNIANAVIKPDAEFWGDAAQRRHQLASRMDEITRESAEDRANYTENLRRLNETEPERLQEANQQFNQAGLFFSGQLGKERGDIRKQYLRQRADALQGFTARERARAEMRRALEAGYSIEDAAAVGAAVDRQIARDEEAASGGYLALNDDVPVSGPAASAAAAQRRAPRSIRLRSGRLRAMTGRNAGQSYVIVRRRGKRYRRYGSGRNVRYVPA